MVVGIDPGLSGGIAWIGKDGEHCCCVMPVIDKRPDIQAIGTLLTGLKPNKVYIERLDWTGGQGATSAKTCGVAYGMLIGFLAARMVPTVEVPASKWKASMGVTGAKLTPKQKKEKSIALAMSLFPCAELKATPKCKVYHDGMGEALLIAEYGRRLG